MAKFNEKRDGPRTAVLHVELSKPFKVRKSFQMLNSKVHVHQTIEPRNHSPSAQVKDSLKNDRCKSTPSCTSVSGPGFFKQPCGWVLHQHHNHQYKLMNAGLSLLKC